MSLSDKIFEARDIVDEHYHEVVDIEDLAEAIEEIRWIILSNQSPRQKMDSITEIFGKRVSLGEEE